MVQETGGEVAPKALARRTQFPVDTVRKALNIIKDPISLAAPIGSKEDFQLFDFIEDKKIASPDKVAIKKSLEEEIEAVLGGLAPEEKKVLCMRFGIGEKSDHTLEEVGKDFGLTRERIRQIETRVLQKVRRSNIGKKLSKF